MARGGYVFGAGVCVGVATDTAGKEINGQFVIFFANLQKICIPLDDN
jgi:hypothetical protein